MHDPASRLPAPDWTAIGEALDRHQRILVTTHVNPDGDGLGAELGLWAYLRSRGKTVRIVNPDPLPPRYAFLGEIGEYEAYDPAVHGAVIADTEVVVVLDISNWNRLGGLGTRLAAASAFTVCIDHHPFENNGMADLYGVDISAAATGQLVYEMIRERRHPVDRTMALGFYVSILTDTGSFRFSNSDARAHLAAAELIQTGLDPNDLYEQVYGNSSLARLRLMGRVLQDMRVEDDGKLVLLVLPRAVMEETGALPSDTEGFVDIARTAKGSEGIALLMERKDGSVKVSLRSRGRMNVNRVAAAMNGGGHRLASGASVAGPLEAAVARVHAGLRQELVRSAAGNPDEPAS
jgi:phosphoesterase RecJ-like protein